MTGGHAPICSAHHICNKNAQTLQQVAIVLLKDPSKTIRTQSLKCIRAENPIVLQLLTDFQFFFPELFKVCYPFDFFPIRIKSISKYSRGKRVWSSANQKFQQHQIFTMTGVTVMTTGESLAFLSRKISIVLVHARVAKQ